MGWVRTSGKSSPGFVADPESIIRLPGRQIDWDYVPDSYRSSKQTVSVNGAVAAGATSITVDALPIALLAGLFLNFGTYAPVTVTVSDGSVSAGDTTLGVAALSGPIPAGTVLDFSGGTNAQVARLSADAAAGATSLTVEPLDGTIANGTTATFPGGTKQARLTANAAAGATTLAVDELEFAIPDNATAIVGGTGDKTIPSGTFMAEMSSGKIVPRAARPGSETAVGVLVGDAFENSREHALSGYGVINGGLLYKELLPESADSSFATYVSEVSASGTGLATTTYSDSRAS